MIPLWRRSSDSCEHLCSDGRPAVCAEGHVGATGRLLDGSIRFSLDGKEIKRFAGVSSFLEYFLVPEKVSWCCRRVV